MRKQRYVNEVHRGRWPRHRLSRLQSHPLFQLMHDNHLQVVAGRNSTSVIPGLVAAFFFLDVAASSVLLVIHAMQHF